MARHVQNFDLKRADGKPFAVLEQAVEVSRRPVLEVAGHEDRPGIFSGPP